MSEELVAGAVFVHLLISECVTLSWEPWDLERTGIPLGGGRNTTWTEHLFLEFRGTEFSALARIWRALVEEPRGGLGSTSLGQDAGKTGTLTLSWAHLSLAKEVQVLWRFELCSW